MLLLLLSIAGICLIAGILLFCIAFNRNRFASLTYRSAFIFIWLGSIVLFIATLIAPSHIHTWSGRTCIFVLAIVASCTLHYLARKRMLKSNRPPPTARWKIDPSIDVYRVSLEDVKLIFAQAEKRLDDTVKTGETISTRTMTLMTVMVGILVTLCGFFISNWKGWDVITSKDFVTVIGFVYIMVLFGYMINNVMPNKYFVLGSEPSELMLPSFFAPGVDKKKITVFLYMSEIENYDYRIEQNLHVNAQRWKRYRYAVIALFILPAILGCVYMGCNG